MCDFEIQIGELAGFELAGRRHINGTIQLSYSGRFIADWPEEIIFHGVTYALEEIKKGAVDPETGTQWENAIYV